MWNFVLFFGSIFGPGVMVWTKLINLNNRELAYSYRLFCSSVFKVFENQWLFSCTNKVQSFSWMLFSRFGWNWLSHSWVKDTKCEILCWECDGWILISWNAILTSDVVSSILVIIFSSQIFTMPAIGINKAWISLHIKLTQTPPMLQLLH